MSMKSDGVKPVLWAQTFTLRDMMWSCKCCPYLFFSLLLEGTPQFGRTTDSVTIGYGNSLNSRVMDVQITDFGDWKFYSNYEAGL